jgi:hypothetical protein
VGEKSRIKEIGRMICFASRGNLGIWVGGGKEETSRDSRSRDVVSSCFFLSRGLE